MEITVNQKNYQLNDTCSVEQMLTEVLNIPVQGIAVAINQTIIPKTDWPGRELQSGDRITVIKATQGG
ncbi:sulfur carrier protein [Pedobacter steynii]|uniref:Sulfur carrier protein n=1 Tax=Pedobacter steynii TaxID=430522 RepID=A0A1H0B9C9_9SPHI|nr:sulfur carrier protein ThiS [Pedobacter steynii]NQX41119.1 sulfur carrier protein ThiS [Pedobacter steynii]SDN42246.1 sulfur carrier protein [Pedobacter steynii]